MNGSNWLLSVIIISVIIIAIKTRKLTPVAAVIGGLLGVCVYAGAGFTGIAMMAAFFVLGTLATSWQMQKKMKKSIAEKNSGQRKARQVIANAGVAAILGLLSYFFPAQTVLFHVMMAAAFSSAMADTLSSELGNVYGKCFYNILTFKKDMRGLDGVISLEGTLAGMAGSCIIALIYCIGFAFNGSLFLIIIIAGTAGNLSDSLLGATFERKGILQNDVVNFLNTLIAALVSFVLF